MQWFKRFFEMSVSDLGDYDCVGQRSRGKGGSTFTGGNSKSGIKSAPKKVVSAPTRRPVATTKSTASAAKENTAPSATSKTTSTNVVNKPTTAKTAAIKTTTKAAPAPQATNAEVTTLRQANETLTKQFNEMKLELDGLITERDFYFDKLRDVEMLLQEMEDSGKGNELTANVFKILYATADGFETQNKQESESESNPVVESTTESAPVEPTVVPEASAPVEPTVVPDAVATVEETVTDTPVDESETF